MTTTTAAAKAQPALFINPILLQKHQSCKRRLGQDLGSNVWTDSSIDGLPRLKFFHWGSLTNDYREEVREEALKCFTQSVSMYSAGALMQCAWGLRSASKLREYCFPLTVENGPGKLSLINTLDTRVLQFSSTDVNIEWDEDLDDDDDIKDAYICFICASALRMITKTDENYVRAWNHINGHFFNLYKINIIVPFQPDPGCLRSLKGLLQTKSVLQSSIAPFLLNFPSSDTRNSGLCRMLFEQHLEFTGMHAYPLTMYCASKLDFDTYEILTKLDHRTTGTALKTMNHIIQFYDFPTEDAEKRVGDAGRLWKYARIFSAEKFVSLQTKNCPILVAILANLAKLAGMSGFGDVTKIKHIADMGDIQTRECKKIAANIYSYALRKRVEKEKIQRATQQKNTKINLK